MPGSLRVVGTLDNWAVFTYLHPGEVIRFHIDDILEEEDVEHDGPGLLTYHAECNSTDH